jgi:hypothetical protein
MFDKAVKVQKQYFINVLNRLDEQKRMMISDEDDANDYYLIFKDGVANAGFALDNFGSECIIRSLFSLGGGGVSTVFCAIMHVIGKTEAYTVSLSCYGENLKKLYEHYGFVVVEESSFDERLANPKWDYDKLGRPKVYEMTLDISMVR